MTRIHSVEIGPMDTGMKAAEADRPLDARAVTEQLDHILAHNLFARSARYQSLLRHVVERRLEGDLDRLKERIIGIEVFGRVPDYDNTLDPIVRINASEVRKRLAQYYEGPGRNDNIRIELIPGSYVPILSYKPLETSQPSQPNGNGNTVFRKEETAANSGFTETSAMPYVASPGIPTPRKHRPRVVLAVIAIILIFIVGGSMVALSAHQQRRNETLLRQFWGPALDTNGPVDLSFGDSRLPYAAPSTMVGAVVLGDFNVMKQVQAFLDHQQKPYKKRFGLVGATLPSGTGSIVLVGPYYNAAVRSVTSALRFHFVEENDGRFIWIQDAHAPSQKTWHAADWRTETDMDRSESYAIVARIMDSGGGRPVFVISGTAEPGGEIAGTLLTDSNYIKLLLESAPSDWQHMNLEAVISTRVIGGKPTTPRVLATQFWR